MNFKRSGNKWTVNEVLSLQREYELLELSIQEIATRHSRSVEAILYKLEAEDLIEHWCNARGFHTDNYISFNQDNDDNDEEYEDDANDDDLSDDNSEDEDEIVNLTHRVNNLEDIVNEVRNMVTNFLVTQNNSIKTSSSVQYKN